MAYRVGQIIGGIVAVWIVAMVLESLIFKRVMDDPVKGKMASVVSAYGLCVLLAGYGMADGGDPVFWFTSIAYLPGALVIGALWLRRGLKLRDIPAKDDLTKTFE